MITPSLPERQELQKLISDGVFAVPRNLFNSWHDDRCRRFLASYKKNPHAVQPPTNEMGETLLLELVLRHKLASCRARAGFLVATGRVLVNGEVRKGLPIKTKAKGSDKITLR